MDEKPDVTEHDAPPMLDDLARARGDVATYRARLREVEGAAAAFAAEADALRPYRDHVAAGVAARLEAAPEYVRTLLAGKEPLAVAAFLDEHEADWARPVPPNLDAGAGRTGGARLAAPELEVARKLGLSAEEFARAKRKG